MYPLILNYFQKIVTLKLGDENIGNVDPHSLITVYKLIIVLTKLWEISVGLLQNYPPVFF